MNRDTLITVLLVIAGIVLAFVLFGAGVQWKSKRSADRPITSTTTAAEQLVAANFSSANPRLPAVRVLSLRDSVPFCAFTPDLRPGLWYAAPRGWDRGGGNSL